MVLVFPNRPSIAARRALPRQVSNFSRVWRPVFDAELHADRRTFDIDVHAQPFGVNLLRVPDVRGVKTGGGALDVHGGGGGRKPGALANIQHHADGLRPLRVDPVVVEHRGCSRMGEDCLLYTSPSPRDS